MGNNVFGRGQNMCKGMNRNHTVCVVLTREELQLATFGQIMKFWEVGRIEVLREILRKDQILKRFSRPVTG